jgi:hypothetical protein
MPPSLEHPVRAPRTLILSVVFLLVATGGASPFAAGTPIRLFNGRDLAGWHTWLVDASRADPRQVFSVTNGLLRISGDGLGYMATAREHECYLLIVEWRWGATNTHWGGRHGKARDSGIFLHATGPDGNSHDGAGAFMAAIECNLFQGATGDLLLIRGTASDGSLIAPRVTAPVSDRRDADGWFTWQPGGRLQTLERWGRINWMGKSADWQDVWDFRGPNDVENPPGAWNRVECEARGDRLRIRVNGRQVNEAFDLWPRRGRILLQCEGSEIFFRRVDLQPLTDLPLRRPVNEPTVEQHP